METSRRAAMSCVTCLAVLALVLSGCTTATPAQSPAAPVTASLPPPHGRFSYQIGGAYPVPAGVVIVDRDRAGPPSPGTFSICYINAYQAQSDDVRWWTRHHPDLLLRDLAGGLVIDKDWDEPLLDISTPARRAALLTVIGGWIDDCAGRGYRAVEADNLDSYTRSGNRLSVDDAIAFGRLLATRAHRADLSIAQKNGADLATRGRRAGFDFAIAEECQVYTECDAYTAVYGRNVIEIEYTDQPRSAFTTACRLRGATISIVLRDRGVSPSGAPGHVERWCP